MASYSAVFFFLSISISFPFCDCPCDCDCDCVCVWDCCCLVESGRRFVLDEIVLSVVVERIDAVSEEEEEDLDEDLEKGFRGMIDVG